MRELYLCSDMTAAVLYIEHDGSCTMHAGLSYKRQDGKISKILVNNSNTEFAPGMIDKSAMEFYVTLVDRRDLINESFGLRGDLVPQDSLVDSGFTPNKNTHLVSYPRIIPLGYRANGWIEGNIGDPVYVDLFADVYGYEAGAWMRRARSA